VDQTVNGELRVPRDCGPAALLKTHRSRLKTEDSRLKTQDSRLRTPYNSPMTTTPSQSPSIDTFPNPRPGRAFLIEHVAPEFTSVCPLTGQPDFGTVRLRYVPHEICVELKSYKFYLQSFRNKGIYYEAVTNQILDDLVALLDPLEIEIRTEWTPRGGLHSHITARHRRRGSEGVSSLL
jgi:7-cyano-7-deazaguanine reductase